MNAGGYQVTGNGSGNGAPSKLNKVKHSPLYEKCREEIDARFPRVAKERFFEQLEAFMVICDVEADAFYIGGSTYYLQTPDDFSPFLMIYFTFASGQVVMQAVHAE